VFVAEMHHRCTITAVLCRAEAKKLYASKPAFDELGIRLVTVVHQMPKLELEVILKGQYWIGGLVLAN